MTEFLGEERAPKVKPVKGTMQRKGLNNAERKVVKNLLQALGLYRAIRPTMPLQYVVTLLLVAMDEGKSVGEYARMLGVSPHWANLPNWVLIRTFSRRLAEVASNVWGGSYYGLHVRFGSNGRNERRDDHAEQTPNPVFYAASRRGESPRCSAISGSVKRASNR